MVPRPLGFLTVCDVIWSAVADIIEQTGRTQENVHLIGWRDAERVVMGMEFISAMPKHVHLVYKMTEARNGDLKTWRYHRRFPLHARIDNDSGPLYGYPS
jgi:hypothetical protein